MFGINETVTLSRENYDYFNEFVREIKSGKKLVIEELRNTITGDEDRIIEYYTDSDLAEQLKGIMDDKEILIQKLVREKKELVNKRLKLENRVSELENYIYKLDMIKNNMQRIFKIGKYIFSKVVK